MREKQIAESELSNNSLKLQEIIKERVNLEKSTKSLAGIIQHTNNLFIFLRNSTDKLETISAERMVLQEEFDKTNVFHKIIK